MDWRNLKREFFYLRKAIWQSHSGWKYLRHRFVLARKILKSGKSLQRPLTHENLSMHILTSHRDVILALWSLASYYQSSKLIGQLYIHDDGTLQASDLEILKKAFPLCRIIFSTRFLDEYGEKLKAYPIWWSEFRQKYPQYFSFKKIIDPYIVSTKPWRLILDSDILWFADPVELREAVESPVKSSLMQYNNGEIFVTFKDATRTPSELSHYNAGIILYHQDEFDVGKFADFLERLNTDEPKNLRFADQLGHAVALKNLSALPVSRYPIKAPVGPNTVARHYTGPRRHLFYLEGVEILKDKVLS